MRDIADLQRQKAQDLTGRSVFEEPVSENEEPIPESLEHKCQRLTVLVAEIMAETNAIGMTADFSSNFPTLVSLHVRMQLMEPDFRRLFTDMERTTSINTCGHAEKSICLGGVTFFALVQESAAERVARMLKDLPDSERQQILESIK